MAKAVRLTISGFLRGQFTQNVLAFKYTPGSAETDFQSALTCSQAFLDHLADPWRAASPVDWVGSSVRSQVFPTVLYNDSGPAVTRQASFAGVAGDRTGNIGTTSTSPLIIVPFEVAGEPRTGKIFFPGVTETDLNNNNYTDDWLATMDDLVEALMVDVTTAGTGTMRYHVYSPKDNEIFIPMGAYISPQVGLLRGRQRPHG